MVFHILLVSQFFLLNSHSFFLRGCDDPKANVDHPYTLSKTCWYMVYTANSCMNKYKRLQEKRHLVSFGILDVYFRVINIKDPAGVHDLTPVEISMDKIIQVGTIFRIILTRSS